MRNDAATNTEQVSANTKETIQCATNQKTKQEQTLRETYGFSAATATHIAAQFTPDKFADYYVRLLKALGRAEYVQDTIERGSFKYTPACRSAPEASESVDSNWQERYVRTVEELAQKLPKEKRHPDRFLSYHMMRQHLDALRNPPQSSSPPRQASPKKRKPKKRHEQRSNEEVFYAETRNARGLSPGEEEQLAKRIQSDDPAAVWELVAGNLRLALHHAKKCVRDNNPYRSLLDLASVAIVGTQEPKTDKLQGGLKRAAELYDPDKGRFAPYARFWIARAVQLYRAQTKRGAYIPASIFGLLARLERTAERLRQEKKREPTREEIIQKFRRDNEKGYEYLTEEWLEQRMPWMDEQHIISLEALEHTPYQGNVRDHDRMLESAIQDEGRILEELLDQLEATPDGRRIRGVVERHAGLSDHGYGIDFTLAEVGAQLNLTRERARQLEQTGLQRLRAIVNRNPDIAASLREYMPENQ